MQESSVSSGSAPTIPAAPQHYVRPGKACSHCQMWQLDCIINRNNAQYCYPCILLSKDCNVICSDESAVAISNAISAPIAGTTDPRLVDHMPAGHGKDNGIGATQSCSPKTVKSSFRFRSVQTKVLKDWVRDHSDRPYPSKEDSLTLQEATGLSFAQVSTWFANYRRRGKARMNSTDASRSASQSLPVDMSTASFQSSDPLERWRNSPPDTEPAAYDAIADAIKNIESGIQLGNLDSWRCASSRGSWSEDQTISEGSTESSLSVASRESHTSSRSGEIKLRSRRKRRMQPRLKKSHDPTKEKQFQCTFCTDRFNKKYDWVRHERTLHLSLETWTCPGTAQQVHDHMTNSVSCVFCDLVEPTAEHLEIHSPDTFHTHNPAAHGSYEPRVFYRKDHLKQHLRLAHNLHKVSNNIEKHWHEVHSGIRSRCGFCDQRFTTWDDRAAHLAQEFREGADMKTWKGSRGLDAAIEARVTFSMPPYLIDNETRSQNPFSASKPTSILHHRGLVQMSEEISDWQTAAANTRNDWDFTELIRSDVATYWETFPYILGQWAQQEMRKGVCLTDEMLQAQGRMIVFDCNDQWNQTEADHPGWLAEFKRVIGIGTLVTDPLLEQATQGVQHLDAPTLNPPPSMQSVDQDLVFSEPYCWSATPVIDAGPAREDSGILQHDWTVDLPEDWSFFGADYST